MKNEDTINEDSLIGIHHKTRVSPATGQPIDDCLFYVRFNEANHGSATYNYSPQIKEHLYGNQIRLKHTGTTTHASGPASDPFSTGMKFSTSAALGPFVI